MIRSHAHRWLVLGIACAANFLTILDLWVVSIAYPAFERAFAPTTLSQVSWILNVYAILLAALLIPAGRIADGFGRRACFLIGLLLFGLASLGCALSPSLGALIACRALKAVAAAMLMPTSLGFVLSAFDPRDRATAVGVWASVGAVAASSGPLLGGFLIALSWRWIFFINVPLVLLTWILAIRYLPNAPSRAPKTDRRRVDAVGALLVFASMSLVCTALVEAGAWPGWRTASALAVGLVLSATFVVHVRRHPDPVVAPRLFAAPVFRVAATGIFAYYVGFAGMLLGGTLLLTDGWHYSVLRAAWAIAPGPLTASIVSLFSGRLSARFGPRNVIVSGAALFALAAAWPLWRATEIPNYEMVFLPSLLLWGTANALIQPTLFGAADAAPGAQLASGSAVLTMSRQLGSAFGVALLVAVLGTEQSAALPGLRRAWAMVMVTAALTAIAGLRDPRRSTSTKVTPHSSHASAPYCARR